MSEYKYEPGCFTVTDAMKKDFDENGYIIVRNLLSSAELEKVKSTIFEHGMINYQYKVPDADGRAPQMALWQHPGTDPTGMVGRCEKVVTTAEKLLGVEELYHYHGKFLLKKPKIGGKFEWHQDYGYWYNHCLKADMMAVFIAVDEATRENGGLQMLSGSHKFGRVNHGFSGGQQGADMERVELLKTRCPLVYGDCQPGDTIFFHSNVLHCSGPNDSDKRRLVLNISYCERSNEPVVKNICPQYTKLQKVPDSAILECTNLSDFSGKNFIRPEDDELVKAS